MKNIENQKKQKAENALLIKNQIAEILELLPVYASIVKAKRFGFDIGFNSPSKLNAGTITLWFEDSKNRKFEETCVNLDSCIKHLTINNE